LTVGAFRKIVDSGCAIGDSAEHRQPMTDGFVSWNPDCAANFGCGRDFRCI
jgi:hypothetical protein